MGVSSTYSDKDAEEMYLKYCKEYQKIYKIKNISKKLLLEKMIIKKVDKPKTFPKFSNEIPFKIKWGKGYILQPLIKNIRWDGENWEYQLEKIGHLYDFQKEEQLVKIK